MVVTNKYVNRVEKPNIRFTMDEKQLVQEWYLHLLLTNTVLNTREHINEKVDRVRWHQSYDTVEKRFFPLGDSEEKLTSFLFALAHAGFKHCGSPLSLRSRAGEPVLTTFVAENYPPITRICDIRYPQNDFPAYVYNAIEW